MRIRRREREKSVVNMTDCLAGVGRGEDGINTGADMKTGRRRSKVHMSENNYHLLFQTPHNNNTASVIKYSNRLFH